MKRPGRGHEEFAAAGTARYAGPMIAVIFHYWLGVILLLVSILAVVGLVGGYLKKVTASQYPPRRNREE